MTEEEFTLEDVMADAVATTHEDIITSEGGTESRSRSINDLVKLSDQAIQIQKMKDDNEYRKTQLENDFIIKMKEIENREKQRKQDMAFEIVKNCLTVGSWIGFGSLTLYGWKVSTDFEMGHNHTLSYGKECARTLGSMFKSVFKI